MITHFQEIRDTIANLTIGYEATIVGAGGENAESLFHQSRLNGTTVTLDTRALHQSMAIGQHVLKEDQQLFVNISTECLEHGFCLPDTLPVGNVVIEISESTPFNNKIIERIQALNDLGIQFAVDDFGTHYSNLDRFLLPWFRPTYVKLDRVFVQYLSQLRTQQIVRSSLRLFQDTGIKLIVEGVENRWQQDTLAKMGVRFMQGYHFAKPAPFEQMVMINEKTIKSQSQ